MMINTLIKTKKEEFKSNKFVDLPGMNEVEEKLYSAISDSHGYTYEICSQLITAGGKRIRPLLVLSSAQCFGPLNSDVINSAVACELVHMASLVHDDIIDQSTLRRNRPSIHVQYGNQASVLVGDYLFAKAFEILSTNKLFECLNLVVEAIGEMCDGEIAQARNRYNLNQTAREYYKRIYEKTGILMAACCQAGALTGGASLNSIKSLQSYGEYIGYAFQIIDDIMDFTGDTKVLGKPVGSDLREGNITLPIIKLVEQKKYKDLIGDFLRGEITDDIYTIVLRELHDNFAIEQSYREAENCIQKAKDALCLLEESEYKSILMTMASKILNRID